MIRSVDGCDDPAYRDRVDVSSSDGRFRCDAVSRIRLNGRDSVLTDARQFLDDFLIEVRQDAKLVMP